MTKKKQEQQGQDEVTAAVLVIGDEILSGRTKDKNIGYMADHFTAIGIDLREVRIVPDITEEIVEAVNAMRSRHTYVFTTGGIGPTHDDITADAIATAFDVEIDFDPRAMSLMEAHYKDDQFTTARKRMARIPKGADLIENAVSAAPGFWIENVLVMAGVPGIMQCMLDAVTPRLKTGKKMQSITFRIDKPESAMAELLADHQKLYNDVSMGSYPHYNKGRFGTHLVLRSNNPDSLEKAEEGLRAKLTEQGIDELEVDK